MANSGFGRRHNGDSTTDLICLSCFQTIAHSREQADLAAAERDHACNPFSDLVQLHSRLAEDCHG
jgi:hypothetical protein